MQQSGQPTDTKTTRNKTLSSVISMDLLEGSQQLPPTYARMREGYWLANNKQSGQPTDTKTTRNKTLSSVISMDLLEGSQQLPPTYTRTREGYWLANIQQSRQQRQKQNKTQTSIKMLDFTQKGNTHVKAFAKTIKVWGLEKRRRSSTRQKGTIRNNLKGTVTVCKPQ